MLLIATDTKESDICQHSWLGGGRGGGKRGLWIGKDKAGFGKNQ